MTQQDTQPPTDTLANRDVIARIIAPDSWPERVPSTRGAAGRYAQYQARSLAKADAILAALTRRAGGDAIPAGEIERLRAVLIETGRELGGLLADDVSTDFLMYVPGEARAKMEALRDGTAVHLNMLRGGIARPSVAQIIHLYGVEALLEGVRAVQRRDADTPKPPAGGDEWSMVNRLRDQEADSVEILSDNPDGDPNNAIVCCGFWTGFVERRFSGDTIADALRSAVEAKDQADRDGHPDVLPAGGDAGDNLRRIYDALPKGPRCRDCGDEDGRCPSLRRPCDPTEWVIELIQSALALPAPVMEGWQPIETCEVWTHDFSRPMLAHWSSRGVCETYWDHDEDFDSRPKWWMAPREGWRAPGDQCIPVNQDSVTHWMPMPTPPAALSEGRSHG